MGLHPKTIYDMESKEPYNQARIIGGKPNGIINFNDTNHQWATVQYDIMRSRNWVPKQINVAQDRAAYPVVPEAVRFAFDRVTAQLTTNDSIQTNQLMDGINRYITSPVVNAVLALQAMDESNHSLCYSIMILDICDDRDKIFRLHEHDEELRLKNEAVRAMYANLYNGDSPSKEDLLMIFVANQILEELVFPGGFVVMFSLENYFPGGSQMFSEINCAA